MKNPKQNALPIHNSKQNTVYILFSGRERNSRKNIKCKNTRGVYCKNTRGVYCKTLEVFIYQIFTGGDILIIPNIELM